MENIYANIAARTGGNIYIGVIGPVRTGKSTLIKQLMEKLVIPVIPDPYRAQRAKDELPQSGSGRTIMTAEPKFVPEEAVEIHPETDVTLRVRMIDSVGYMIPGAVGAEENGAPRMVTTPWCDHEVPMTEAAELGTRKVMEDHCTVGLVVTTDGTVTDIPRQDYREAEDRAIRDMAATGKPFLVVINSREPAGEAAREVKAHIESTYGICPVAADCQALDTGDLNALLSALLYAFPLRRIGVRLPGWITALEPEHPVRKGLTEALLQAAQTIKPLRDARRLPELLGDVAELEDFRVVSLDPATGSVRCRAELRQGLFYEILSRRAGVTIENEGSLLTLLTQLAAVKQDHDRISAALSAAEATGYGIVMPTADHMTLQSPQVLKKGGSYGVKLKAGASSIHMIRVDIDTEISPMVGDEAHSKELAACLESKPPEELWESNIFGKSVYELIREGLTAKLVRTPEDVRAKFRGALTRIVNEGAAGLVCLIL